MENENKSAWGKILKVIITVLTAVATTFGLQACISPLITLKNS